MEYYWVILIVVGVIALYILSAYLKIAKCPNCKARKVREISRKLLREETVYFRVKEQGKEYENPDQLRTRTALEGMQYIKAPNRVSVRERLLPGKRIYYRVEYRCQNCGESFSREEYVDEKPIVQ